MRSAISVAALALLLLSAVLTAAGCVGMAAPSDGNAAPFGVDQATFAVIDFRRSGGPDSVDERAVMYLDGHVVLEPGDGDPLTFQLSQAEQNQIDAAFEAASFFENTRAITPTTISDDLIAYSIERRGLLLQGSLATSEDDAPDWAEPLIPLLNNLLLSPDPAAVRPYRPEEPTPTATARSTSAPYAPSVVLLQFTRSSQSGDDRVLLNLDRTFSVARRGNVVEDQLSREEMAGLLKVLETADLQRQAGDYLADSNCSDCATLEVVYRNVVGEYTVLAAEGEEPDWLLPVVDALTAQFLPDDAAVAGTPAATSAPVASPVASETPSLQPSPSVAPEPAPSTPTAVAQPPAPQSGAAYSTLDFLAELANLGVQVEVAPGRVAKPYLSTYGLIVRVDGEPVQVFQYATEASLTDDVDGLDAGASSIDGLPLAWPATPHFWRKAGLLVLAVTDEPYYVDLISQVMGPPFAGQ